MKPKSIFAQRLKEARKNAKMSQEELSKFINYDVTTISSYERGRSEPDLKTLITIADVLNVTTDWLLGKDKSPLIDMKDKAIITEYASIKNKQLVPILDKIHYVDSKMMCQYVDLVPKYDSRDFDFITIIHDDNCRPKYSKDDMVFVKLNCVPQCGDYVCVSFKQYSFIRQYLIDDNGDVILSSSSEKDKNINLSKDYTIVGVVAYSLVSELNDNA